MVYGYSLITLWFTALRYEKLAKAIMSDKEVMMAGMNVQKDTAKEMAERARSLLQEGKIRNHKLGNSAAVHTGEIEKKEVRIYRNFLPSKNCSIVYSLTGSENYE